MTDDPPFADPLDRARLERDCDISFFVAGGPGGQHRNKVATGVRLTHRPSGLVIVATERRSQAANRDVAFERLAERLRAMSVQLAPRVATRPSRAAVTRRLAAKQHRARIKQSRRPTHEE
jgi:protein subunit release factor B